MEETDKVVSEKHGGQSTEEDRASDDDGAYSSQAGAEMKFETPEPHIILPLDDPINGGEEPLRGEPEGLNPDHEDEAAEAVIVFMTAWAGFFFPLSASIYFPALNTLAVDLKASSELVNLTLTSYMIFQGVAPTIFGDLADMTERRPTYFLGFVIYIAANIGLALQNSYPALFLLRCLQSSSST
ncbi:hypothetical protein MMC30_007635 [Trapelia coarctata]|nr:hypothetical protein [Trapelia coarctata]